MKGHFLHGDILKGSKEKIQYKLNDWLSNRELIPDEK